MEAGDDLVLLNVREQDKWQSSPHFEAEYLAKDVLERDISKKRNRREEQQFGFNK